MIDYRKVWVAASIGLVILAGIAFAVVLGMNSISRGTSPSADAGASTPQSTADTAAAPTPITSPAEAAPVAGSYDQELSATDAIYERASAAAAAAATWDSSEPDYARETRYTAAGFAPALVNSFRPVWADVLGRASTATISGTANGKPGLNSVTGAAGHRQYRIGVTITYQGSWTANGAQATQSPATATWWVTVDEASGHAAAIDQPTTNEIQIRLAS